MRLRTFLFGLLIFIFELKCKFEYDLKRKKIHVSETTEDSHEYGKEISDFNFYVATF